ncbi:hypothetical protein WT60_23175 [Burkholderia sp. MSMB617WGS]|uniref:Uncharacterized protein n=1 Tax=Burkholderia savannae TaxID=1637837 RepID=A0ABR5T4C2_9BURK|nr:hypothetical protein WT60_23175 [Burkholderia sp. MSMB617WGS]KVK78539.1 hypothetical protein WS91_14835 [Burkholderia sp. MSMB1498]KWZ38075.1 hypothetical protein WS72_24600 [Burkholderia savannae]KWZ47885.1 hypothetical protein WS73_04910 [Burkholderia savannae]
MSATRFVTEKIAGHCPEARRAARIGTTRDRAPPCRKNRNIPTAKRLGAPNRRHGPIDRGHFESTSRNATSGHFIGRSARC